MKNEAIELLTKLLEIPSVNGTRGEKNISAFIANYFKGYGIECEVIKVDEKRDNLIAYIEGEDSEVEVILNGHMDTVPFGELKMWDTPPDRVVIKGNRIYGRGSSDMKSGLAGMIYALTHLKKKPKKSIVFIATCDEEKDGTGALEIVKTKVLEEAKFMIIGEPTSLNLGSMQKGCLWTKIKLYGKTSHGAYPEKGINAIEKLYPLIGGLCHFVKEFDKSSIHNSTAQINVIEGGNVPNMTADNCFAILDIRMVKPLTKDIVIKELDRLIKKMLDEEKEIVIEYEILNHRNSVESDEDSDSFKRLIEEIIKVTTSCKKLGFSYFSDGSIFVENNSDLNVVLFGPGIADMAHRPNEYVEADKYLDYIEILRNYISY